MHHLIRDLQAYQHSQFGQARLIKWQIPWTMIIFFAPLYFQILSCSLLLRFIRVSMPLKKIVSITFQKQIFDVNGILTNFGIYPNLHHASTVVAQ